MDQRADWQAFAEYADAAAWEWMGHPRPARARLRYERDGVGAIFERLETLRELHEGVLHHYTSVARALGMSRSLLVVARGEVDDKLDGTRIGTMVSRGLAYEERRVMHDTAAIDEVLWRRRFEALAEQLRGTDSALRSVMDSIKSERLDLQAQARLIQVGIELGLH